MNVFLAVKQYFDSKNVKFTTLNGGDDYSKKCEEYNKSHAVQFILLDMKMDDLNISLDSVDLGKESRPFKLKENHVDRLYYCFL